MTNEGKPVNRKYKERGSICFTPCPNPDRGPTRINSVNCHVCSYYITTDSDNHIVRCYYREDI